MSISQPSTRHDPNSQAWKGFQTRSMPEVDPWIETLGRLGHFAKGLVYFIIGVLAFKLAIGAGGEISGSRDAIREIGQQSYGRILLGLTTIGLFGYTVWRWVQAVKDTEGAGHDIKGMVKRTGYFVSGAAYLALGVFAGSLALGLGTSGEGGSGNGLNRVLLESTWGRVLLGVAGLITVAVAVYFVYKAYRAKFMSNYNLAEMSETTRKLALRVGRIGLSTRAIAFAIIGGFIGTSAYQGTADGEIAGMSDALAAIAAQSYGKVMIGIVGFGLMCYALHMALLGWFRQFNVSGK
ncbi:DUF1206 domain-containing protein [Neorhodopirellula pilleata]|uniref:DUF1206 domain-containing protein n=1 Tax=Neorhodopirellula pilleata TaxID=2714738 RepID=A0A5C6AAR5_9BACT|nr:DUF1206 domain-containing protein [Neorhodopirellula pilleata]TWT96245.1 hypothetical protein Pla100_27210 [Neorhodopirellula pilleata]